MLTNIDGTSMDRSLKDFAEACVERIEVEEATRAPDQTLIALLADAVRLAREMTVRDERDAHHHCARHTLWFAGSPTPSLNVEYVYVICGCGRRRCVARAAWEAEEQRRAQQPQEKTAGKALVEERR